MSAIERRAAGGATPARARGLSGLFGWACILGGIALIGWTAAQLGYGLWQERQSADRWHQQIATHPPPVTATDPDPNLKLGPVDGIDFAIRVPKIGYFATVQEGTDSNVLLSGPGHYPETQWPGRTGNVGIAAHNTYWIQFGDLANGDEVDLETRYGTYKYRVTDRRIVNPSDRTILVPTPDRRVTLTTCWPLWAGAFAQQRLVFTAEQFYPTPPDQRLR